MISRYHSMKQRRSSESFLTCQLFNLLPLYAEVIIPLALPKNYTWSVPEYLLNQIREGVRVEVVLGKNKKYAGVVKRLHHEQPEHFETKDILNILDVEPIVFPGQ